jgi:hypothetical protein
MNFALTIAEKIILENRAEMETMMAEQRATLGVPLKNYELDNQIDQIIIEEIEDFEDSCDSDDSDD